MKAEPIKTEDEGVLVQKRARACKQQAILPRNKRQAVTFALEVEAVVQ